MACRKPLRSQLYRAARDLGNVQARDAVQHTASGWCAGKVYRTTNGINRRMLKDLGLQIARQKPSTCSARLGSAPGDRTCTGVSGAETHTRAPEFQSP